VVIRLALITQALPIEDNGPCRLNGPRIEMPAVRRDHPRPAQEVAFPRRLEYERTTVCARYFQRDPAAANEIELMGLFTLSEDELIHVEANVAGAVSQQLNVPWFASIQEGMVC
jgi:hypothetical protein